MARIAVTGAAGKIGRETLPALSEHNVTALTHRDHDDIESTVIELEDKDCLVDAFTGYDSVVHMAANGSATAPWESVNRINIDGTYNVFDAAREAGIERVIFGSSNHITHMYNMPAPDEPSGTITDARSVSTDDSFRPSSYYGVSKLAGEGLGSLYADRYGLEVINLRIGYLQTEATLRDHQDDEPKRARQARAMYLSPRDYRQAIRLAVTVDLNQNPLTVNLVSRNDDRYHTLIEALRGLGYHPRDNSAEILDS